MLDFSPLSEEEAKKLSFSLAAPGTYRFTVLDASDEYSKNGNAMIKLELQLTKDEDSYKMYDFLVSVPSMMFKLRHFCFATNLSANYNAGKLTASDCVNKSGDVEVMHKKRADSDEVRAYVKDYVAKDNQYDSAEAVAYKPSHHDIPF